MTFYHNEFKEKSACSIGSELLILKGMITSDKRMDLEWVVKKINGMLDHQPPLSAHHDVEQKIMALCIGCYLENQNIDVLKALQTTMISQGVVSKMGYCALEQIKKTEHFDLLNTMYMINMFSYEDYQSFIASLNQVEHYKKCKQHCGIFINPEIQKTLLVKTFAYNNINYVHYMAQQLGCKAIDLIKDIDKKQQKELYEICISQNNAASLDYLVSQKLVPHFNYEEKKYVFQTALKGLLRRSLPMAQMYDTLQKVCHLMLKKEKNNCTINGFRVVIHGQTQQGLAQKEKINNILLFLSPLISAWQENYYKNEELLLSTFELLLDQNTLRVSVDDLKLAVDYHLENKNNCFDITLKEMLTLIEKKRLEIGVESSSPSLESKKSGTFKV